MKKRKIQISTIFWMYLLPSVLNAATKQKIKNAGILIPAFLLLVNPIKTPGYAGGISELQLQAKTSYAIIILSPPRHKKA